MSLRSLGPIEHAIRSSWSAATCDPVDLAEWSQASSARGQCGTTALVLQDLLGGELLVAEVSHADGTRQGVHWWNRLPGGVEVDLTAEQFTAGEVIGEPAVVERPADLTGSRVDAQYRALAQAVQGRLAPPG